MNGRHSVPVTRTWGPTVAAAAVSSLPPAALAAGLSGAGFGLALDSTPLAASGAVAATVGIVAQRSADRRLRRRLRQERARNRLEVHDLQVRLEQATRHLAEAVALAEAATRAMSGAPLVLAEHGQAVLDAAAAAASSAPSASEVAAVSPAVPETFAPAVPETFALPEPLELPEPFELPEPAESPEPAELREGAPVEPAVARLSGPTGVFGEVVVPATPADLFTPANGLPVPPLTHDWFVPARPSGLPPAPPSPAVGITLPVTQARSGHLVTAGPSAVGGGAGRPPGPREPVSGPIPVLTEARSAGSAKLPARFAEAKVVDLSLLAPPPEPALIVVRNGRHTADHTS